EREREGERERGRDGREREREKERERERRKEGGWKEEDRQRQTHVCDSDSLTPSHLGEHQGARRTDVQNTRAHTHTHTHTVICGMKVTLDSELDGHLEHLSAAGEGAISWAFKCQLIELEGTSYLEA